MAISNSNYSKGFTLIEMVVAVAIFAVVGVLAYGGLNYVLKDQAHLKESSEKLKNLQLAFRYIERDVAQLTNRSIRNQYQDLQPAFVGDGEKAVSFTHSGLRNPAGLVRSRLQRVTYEVADSTLTRYTWAHLDGAIAEEFFDTELLSDVERFDMRYLDNANAWQTTWPPLNSPTAQSLIPRAIEVTLKLENWEEIKRIFAAPAPT